MSTRSRFKGVVSWSFAVALSIVGATFRWGDSAHAIGSMTATGGRVRHEVQLEGGLSRYTLIVTATVLPPYAGDATVTLEGEPAIPFRVDVSGPVVDLGLYRRPAFDGKTFLGLRPWDHIAMWVTLRPSRDSGSLPDRAGRYSVVLRDVKTGQAVLTVPVVFASERGPRGARRSRHE